MNVIPISEMKEEDIKRLYITPSIDEKWKDPITMETKITDGKMNNQGNRATSGKPKFEDYVLYIEPGKPIAVVEAKDNSHGVSFGLQQTISYAKMLDVPFAFSSNGDGFVEDDFLTGSELLFPVAGEGTAIYMGRGLSAIKAEIDKVHLYLFLLWNERNLVKQATGTTFVAITKDVVCDMLIPVPSIERRIVFKIEEFMPYLSLNRESTQLYANCNVETL